MAQPPIVNLRKLSISILSLSILTDPATLVPSAAVFRQAALHAVLRPRARSTCEARQDAFSWSQD